MVTTSTVKKSTSTKVADAAKSSQKATTLKLHHTTHPPWIDMITECITMTPDGTRHGVSRPAIKKFVDSKYHLEMNNLVSSQLNRAIHQGADKGNFILPKGPSGKVKLAPRRQNDTAKENTKPASKRSAGIKETAVEGATKGKKTPRITKAVATTAPPKSGSAEKKYHSAAKKARTSDSSTRRTAERKAGTAQAIAKKTATRRAPALKTRRGEASGKRTTRSSALKQRLKKVSRK